MVNSIEAARILGIARSTVFRRARLHGIGQKQGRAYMFSAADMERMRSLDACTPDPSMRTGPRASGKISVREYVQKDGRKRIVVTAGGVSRTFRRSQSAEAFIDECTQRGYVLGQVKVVRT